jgi:hypothetical protein
MAMSSALEAVLCPFWVAPDPNVLFCASSWLGGRLLSLSL